MRHVIIGTGPAGVIAAETIRERAPADEILLIGREAEAPYARMAIPLLLAGQIREAGTHLRKDAEHFAKLGIAQRHGSVTHIDSRSRELWMDDGGTVAFDRLLIASGASPDLPAIPGIGSPGVHACWTLQDAHRIMRLARRGAHVILIGAGFIGCVVMEALAARGVRLTVIEKRSRLAPNMLSQGAGNMVQRWCENRGITVHTATRVGAIRSDGTALAARLSSGQWLTADLIVCTTGASPNIGFARGSGIHCMQGIVVDAAMQTNVEGIYAAGDCAEVFDSATQATVISGVQANAADQAYCAALNMTGTRAFQHGVRQVNALDTMGLTATSFGQWRGVSGGQWVEFNDERYFRYLRLEFEKDMLIGFNAIGMTEQAAMLRHLVRDRVALGEWKDALLKDPTLVKEAYAACAGESEDESGPSFVDEDALAWMPVSVASAEQALPAG
jgi:NAD(P)H-nitrite reductase large subunit